MLFVKAPREEVEFLHKPLLQRIDGFRNTMLQQRVFKNQQSCGDLHEFDIALYSRVALELLILLAPHALDILQAQFVGHSLQDKFLIWSQY